MKSQSENTIYNFYPKKMLVTDVVAGKHIEEAATEATTCISEK